MFLGFFLLFEREFVKQLGGAIIYLHDFRPVMYFFEAVLLGYPQIMINNGTATV